MNNRNALMPMKNVAYVLIALVVLVLGYLLFTNTTKAPTTDTVVAPVPSPEAMNTESPVGTSTITNTQGSMAPKTVTITYDGTSFSPRSVSIHAGDKVTFVNTNSSRMWVASDPHPTHQGYSGTTVSQHCPDSNGTAFDQCSNGTSYTFTFVKTGSWGYHDHTNRSATGTVVVTP